MKKHEWLKLCSHRTQPYTIDDISVIVPSVKNRFDGRMKWFWPQYIEKTHSTIIKNTLFPCDPGEKVPQNPIEITPRWIVPKTLAALDQITTRLTFRLANDIMIVRDNWWEILLEQFNAEEKLQIIGELQNGISFQESQDVLQEDWDFIKREYAQKTTAAEYLHGARLFAQTAVWRAYYNPVQRYTMHDHDEIFFTQMARGDGIIFRNFQGINLYLAHVGVTNRDFTPEYIREHIGSRRRELSKASDKHAFVVVRP